MNRAGPRTLMRVFGAGGINLLNLDRVNIVNQQIFRVELRMSGPPHDDAVTRAIVAKC